MVAGPPPRAGSFQYSDGTTLRVTGLGLDVRNTHLQPEFGEFGHVLRIHVLQGKGVAFVEYKDKDDANDAMGAMDGRQILGCTISVSVAGPPPDPRTRAKEDGTGQAPGSGGSFHGSSSAPTHRERGRGQPREGPSRDKPSGRGSRGWDSSQENTNRRRSRRRRSSRRRSSRSDSRRRHRNPGGCRGRSRSASRDLRRR
mmetsp:Transcript_73101/g.141404  ORF Transcript_73101/g.141404 Transcript_73101/m.141404 type:complete len:199 (+) Transcript_73101:65-661(+)